MARTAIPNNDPTRAGSVFSQIAADMVDGNYLDNPERCILLLNNSTGSPINCTIQYNGTWDGLAVPGRVISCPGPSGTITILGNFKPSSHYQDGDSGRLYINSASAGLNVSAIRFPVGA